ncbi:MAG: hypothetical protein A2066_07140 [Bacteroidetes bacterium GWB2_41_8]|nr:MAG: hypothetical protein A2066_07140 [Bacteroidetes bacterium GWB2_41_8]
MRKFQILLSLLLLTITVSAKSKDGWQALFNGKNLTGWHQLNGQAKYHVEKGEIVGTTVANTPNSFLATDINYGDFILELDLLVANEMNSGIQFRSISNPEVMNGRVHGYQCEVDPSARGWSGGIYDEARRGWLYTGELNQAAKTAFKLGEWNHYRIECVGSSIRTWVNGVPVAYVLDDMTSSGLIALQVHSIGKDVQPGQQIRWKNIRIKTTGLKATDTADVFVVNLLPNTLSSAEKQQGWKMLFDGKTTTGWKAAGQDKFPSEGWKVEDGTMMAVASTKEKPVRGTDIVTDEKFSAFEFQFEFNFAEGANSGVKYFTGNGGPSIGLEYQVLDDKKHPDAKMGVVGNRTMASLYDLIPADKQDRFVKPAGQWNIGRIVVYPDNRIEHWLNGMNVVEYVRGSSIYKALVARSKYAEFENFGMVKEAPIMLQYHQDQVKFRSLKIRNL